MVYREQDTELMPGGTDYPRWRYHWTGKSSLVKNSVEERALGGGWAGTPAAFDPYRGARPAKSEHQNPVKWVDEWPVPGLCSEHRNKIKAALLRADAAFARSPDAESGCLASMRYAVDGIARVLFDAGILTEQLLEKDIPLLVWDSAIAGGWWRFASETRQDIFPEELGHYWVWRDEREDWPGLFRAEAADWRSKLLDGPTQHPNQRDSAGAKPSRKSPAELLNEYKVKKHIRTQELVAEDLGLERSVYFDLKAGRKIREETYAKAALHIGCSPGDLKP